MGGAQPLAITMNGGVALCVDVDAERIDRRIEHRYLDEVADSLDDAIGRCLAARDERRALSVGVVGNAAAVLPALVERDFPADIVTDQTSAHDPLSYSPADLTVEATARDAPATIPTNSCAVPGSRWPTHCAAMVAYADKGAEVFDYGNSLRTEAALGGFERAFDYPGFLPAYIRPLFCEGKGPFRWVALSGDPADIAATDRAVLEEFPDDEALRRWIGLAGERVAFQGLPARICWLGYGERHRLGLRFNEMVRTRRGVGADRDRPRPPRLRIGGVAVPRDRGDGRRLRRDRRLAAAQRPRQHGERGDVGEHPPRRRRRHRALDPRRDGVRRRRQRAGRRRSSSGCSRPIRAWA